MWPSAQGDKAVQEWLLRNPNYGICTDCGGAVALVEGISTHGLMRIRKEKPGTIFSSSPVITLSCQSCGLVKMYDTKAKPFCDIADRIAKEHSDQWANVADPYGSPDNSIDELPPGVFSERSNEGI